MKFKIHEMFLSLFFALGLCFSFSIQASAHPYERSDGHIYEHPPGVEDVTAEDVENAAAADKEQYTKDFLLHAATHLNLINEDTNLDEENAQEKSREVVIFARNSREPGVFNHGETYIIGITERGAITNHGLYQHLYGSRYVDIIDEVETAPVKVLRDDAGHLSSNDDPTCVDYTYDGQDRVACAIKQDTPAGFVITTVAGFHHAEGDLRRPDCPTFTGSVTAEQVEKADPSMKKNLLRDFVKGVIKAYEAVQLEVGAAVFTEDMLDPRTKEGQSAAIARIYEKALCFQEERTLRYGSIYAFIMDPTEGVAFMSGNDLTRNGLSVNLNNADHMDRPVKYNGTHEEPNVLKAIHRTLTGTTPPDTADPNDIEAGDNGFFRYHWVNPTRPETVIDNYLEMGVTPGTALKESYIEVVDIGQGLSPAPILYVFGSGIYPEGDDMTPPGDDMMAEGGDDGCAIAAADNAPQSALLNLFLAASILFSVIFLRKRV